MKSKVNYLGFLSLLALIAVLGWITENMAEMISLVPFMFLCTYLYGGAQAVRTAFGLSFAVAIIAFTVALVVLEWRERKGAENDSESYKRI